jgi:hypothetical protein
MTSGGQYINLQAVNNATAIASLGTDAPQFLGATKLKAESVDGIYPSMPQAWADYHLVCGRLSASEADVANVTYLDLREEYEMGEIEF